MDSIDGRSVVLLHGLGRSARSMRVMQSALEDRGYRVWNLDYPSRTANVDALAADVARQVIALANDTPLDFVTHSLGGILLRVAVARDYLPLGLVGRVVMLGPPNAGSHIADALPPMPVVGAVYRRVTGPAGLELGVGETGVADGLPPLPFEAGIIAGSRSVNPILSRFLPGDNDGKVTVANAAVAGMRAFLVVPHSHPFLMRAPVVISQTLTFLETGEFATP